MLQVPRLTAGRLLIPWWTNRLRLYSDRIYPDAGGLAKALGINLGSGQMAANGDQPHEPMDRRRLIVSTSASLLVLVLCLFLPAGTWAWSRGWLFLVVLV